MKKNIFKNTSPIELLLISSMICLIIYYLITYILAIQTYNMDMGGQEQFMVFLSKLLIEKKQLYFPVEDFPYIRTLYTPLYFHLINLVHSCLFSSEEIDIRQLYLIGRYLNLFFNITTAWVLFFICKQLRIHSILYVLVMILLYLFHLPEHNIAVRPEALKVLTICIAVYFLIIWNQKKYKLHFAILSILFSVISFYVKQDAIVFTSIIYFFSAFIINKKNWILLLYSLTITIVTFIIWNHIKKGIIFDNFFYANLEFSMAFYDRWVRDIKQTIFNSFIPFIIISYSLIKYNNKVNKTLFYTTFTFYIFSIVSSIKFGAAANYYTIFYITLSFNFVYSLHIIYLHKPYLRQWVFLFFFLVLYLNFHFFSPYKKSIENQFKTEYLSYIHKKNKIKQTYNGKKALIFDAYLYNFLDIGSFVAWSEVVMFDYLYIKHNFNYKYSYKITTNERFKSWYEIVSSVDILVMDNTQRAEEVYNKTYSEYFVYDKDLYNYKIYIKR